MKKGILILIVSFLAVHPVAGEEGMWLPQLLKQLNENDMRLKGLQLTAADLYNPDSVSLKDAIVLFGGGCTAELISAKGLLLTNHHCGFGQIQEHSTLEKNYLRDGFWAMEEKDEIPCPGLSVTFIVKIEDVTAQFNAVLNDTMSEPVRNDLIKQTAERIEKSSVAGTQYKAKVRQFFSGNEFYLITTETFEDVRMVGAPPSSVGKFGGDTDNWMWPRHTGDFSLFRIYAGQDNKPAAYNAANKPYVPKKYFPVSIKGIREDDFTMVYGFPGRTQEYISSYALQTLITVTNPDRVKARDERLRIIDEAMRSSEELHLKYAAKQSSISNGWKKMKGETKGLKESDAFGKKQKYEEGFQQWAGANKKEYATLLPAFKKLYSENLSWLKANDFYLEAAFTPEIIDFAGEFNKLEEALKKNDTSVIRNQTGVLTASVTDYFKDYDKSTDALLFEHLLKLFDSELNDSLKPEAFVTERNRYNGNFKLWAEDVFSKSLFTDSSKVRAFLKENNSRRKKILASDPAYKLSSALNETYNVEVLPNITNFTQQATKLNRNYMAAQREYEPARAFYPDANSTLRVTYGRVKGYVPRDGVYYTYQTYLDGIMEKYIPGHEEFDLPAKLIELYKAKDYGRYAVNGRLPVAFIASNHTTGGNSGSPVLNAKGELIGTNFDRVWEGTMSDVSYNPDICRNVTLDVRYTLFIIDKYANAQRLMNEIQVIE